MASASSMLVRNRPFPAYAPGEAPAVPPARPILSRRDMVWIEGRRFLMGSDRYYPEERPKRRVAVDGFWIDRTPVTNADFARFVAATGYLTRAEAERGGSMLFTPTSAPVPLDRPERWWSFTPGADWRHPGGPGTSLAGLGRHPVVHLALADVEAYCRWAGTDLPSEEEWELAAKGGLADADFAWGDVLEPDGERMANLWQGVFPCVRAGEEWRATAPVTAYPANGYGLYDMIGNVWEWTGDWWSRHPVGPAGPAGSTVQQRASADAADPRQIARRVVKGGSHLCGPDHCRRYRPAARQPQPVDASSSHVGLRCVLRPPERLRPS